MNKLFYLLVTFFLINYCAFLSAQTGPGGINSTSSLSMWLKADDLNLTDGAAVSAWDDATSNGNDAGQSSSGKQPSYVASSLLNGMPAVSFSGGTSNTTSDNLEVADNSNLDNSQGLTFYSVLRLNSVGSPNVQAILGKRISSGTSSEWAYTLYFYTSNRLYLDLNSQNNRFGTPSGYSNNTNYLLNMSFDGYRSAANRARIYTQGSLSTTATESSTSIVNSGQPLIIGTMNPNYGKYFSGLMVEIMVFSDTLSTTQRIIVDNYLSAKYNTALNSNDLYTHDNSGNGDFDFDVAGIGQNSDGTSNTDAQGTGIVRINSASNLGSGEWLFWGHDGAALDSWSVVDTPVNVQARVARVWRVDQTGDVGTVSLSFDLSDVAGSVTSSDLRLLIDTDNDGVFSDETVVGGGVISGATNTSGNVYQWTGVAIDDNDRFTIGSINESQTPLPVDLVKFEAIPNADKKEVHLLWITASEINNDYFKVEKTEDLFEFELIEVVPGAGTSNEKHEYEVTDYHPNTHLSYYCLSQVDFDGNETKFPMEKVEFENKTSFEMKLYPNPLAAGQKLQVKIPKLDQGAHSLLVNDFIGKSHAVNITSINMGDYELLEVEFDQNLSRGVYLVQYELNGKTETYQLLVE